MINLEETIIKMTKEQLQYTNNNIAKALESDYPIRVLTKLVLDQTESLIKEKTENMLEYKKLILSKNNLKPMYQSGYTTGGRDYYECPICGATIPYDDKYTMNDFNHSSDCLYTLVMELENYSLMEIKDVSDC